MTSKSTRRFVRQWLANGKLVGVGDSYALALDDVDKCISSQLVLIVSMYKKGNARRNISMRHKRKVFSYS